jgi:RNA polymerase sigma-70 factor (ECF subfamily)
VKDGSPIRDTDSTPTRAAAATASPFTPTRWTLILRARGGSSEARAALSELCDAYYQPVLRFLCCEGREEDAARELTQEFFARVLDGSGFDEADPERGRFRSYLLGALKHFLADQRKREHRLKRGGGVATESLDAAGAEDESSWLQIPDALLPAPDAFFDRAWAWAVMARALMLLEKEFAAMGKADHFDTLKQWLIGEVPSLSQLEAARRLGLSEGAVKVVIHRLRKRFRDAVRAEISQTLRDPAPALVDEELRHLIAALS